MNNADQGVRFQWIAPSSICIILHIQQKVNSIIDFLFIQNIHRALKKMLSKLIDLIPFSLRIQPPLIRSRYYVRIAKSDVCDSHVVAGANERRLYSQAKFLLKLLLCFCYVINSDFYFTRIFNPGNHFCALYLFGIKAILEFLHDINHPIIFWSLNHRCQLSNNYCINHPMHR